MFSQVCILGEGKVRNEDGSPGFLLFVGSGGGEGGEGGQCTGSIGGNFKPIFQGNSSNGANIIHLLFSYD